jgi:2-polyprenyl-3-methyl-5-hydroxy-6-metoxy-1,4-benzoquinol methylase
MKSLLGRIPVAMNGRLIKRVESCGICSEDTGERIAVVDYWDIKTSGLIKCLKCGHVQLDPMLTDTETSKGCNAFYIEQASRSSNREEYINYVRNFRRGVVFGYSLKRKKIFPRNVLELGPGSGYFSAGLKFVFPDVEITVMDINSRVVNYNKEHHKYKVIHNIPDHFIPDYINKFDLVVARDFIEHVSDISKVLKNVNQYLTSDGFFHFITPNGHEDAWKHYLTTIFTNSTSELLINHVNYYDGKGLRKFLIQLGFYPVDYYTYKITTTLRGNGWRKHQKLMSPVSVKKSADTILMTDIIEKSDPDLEKDQILDKWYIQKRAKWITYIFSLYQHYSIIRIKPELKVGHEIYGLFKKNNLYEA